MIPRERERERERERDSETCVHEYDICIEIYIYIYIYRDIPPSLDMGVSFLFRQLNVRVGVCFYQTMRNQGETRALFGRKQNVSPSSRMSRDVIVQVTIIMAMITNMIMIMIISNNNNSDSNNK